MADSSHPVNPSQFSGYITDATPNAVADVDNAKEAALATALTAVGTRRLRENVKRVADAEADPVDDEDRGYISSQVASALRNAAESINTHIDRAISDQFWGLYHSGERPSSIYFKSVYSQDPFERLKCGQIYNSFNSWWVAQQRAGRIHPDYN
ncbi:unnamed protein product [Phytophthora lilii]|uniref:Unnamed protein product n=1 Tax=Phytophthora lilii TaxID=2077276 RepID=A0A9W6WQQ3_9STRA|nr:unnamed protein product [Phytophthora lilii]